MIRPVIVLTAQAGDHITAAYLGTDVAKAEAAYTAAVADESNTWVALYYYPNPRLHCEPAAQRAMLAASKASQRDPAREDREQLARENATKRITAEREAQIHREELAKVHSTAAAAAIHQVAHQAVSSAIADTVTRASRIPGTSEDAPAVHAVPPPRPAATEDSDESEHFKTDTTKKTRSHH